MIKVRKAKTSDVPMLVKLWVEFMKDHDGIVIRADPRLKEYKGMKRNAPLIYKKFISKHISSRSASVFIAEVEGDVAGYVLVYVQKEIPIFTLKRYGYISNLYVKPQFRSMKVSSALVSEAMCWFKKKGLRYASLKMYPANRHAHMIYTKWGFFDYHLEMRRKV